MNDKELNTFKRKYLNLTKRLIKNAIIHDSNTTHEHRELVCFICEWLRNNNYVFYTKVYTKLGEIVDIVAPGLPYPFIEIRHSEKDKKKEYRSEYDKLRIFVDTDNPWGLL